MNLLDVLSHSHQCWHGTEWLTEEVSVKACDDYSDAAVSQCLYYLNYRLIEELSLIDTYNLYVICNFQHSGW